MANIAYLSAGRWRWSRFPMSGISVRDSFQWLEPSSDTAKTGPRRQRGNGTPANTFPFWNMMEADGEIVYAGRVFFFATGDDVAICKRKRKQEY
jgi:hypothetical protein